MTHIYNEKGKAFLVIFLKVYGIVIIFIKIILHWKFPFSRLTEFS